MELNFSNNVKDLITISKEEAIRMGNDFIGIEHFLLAMTSLKESGGYKVISQLSNIIKVRKEIESLIKSQYKVFEDLDTLKNIPLVKQAEKALKITYLEAKLDNQATEISTIHLLQSILKSEDTLVSNILGENNINYESVKSVGRKIKEYDDGTNKGIRKFNLNKKNPLDLYFDLSEFSEADISKIISLLSEVYNDVSGDELEIVGMSRLDLYRTLELA